MTTRYKFVTALAFATGVLTAISAIPAAQAQMDRSGTEMVTNGPQMNPGDRSGSGSAQRNVSDSQRYETLLHSNPSFRANRMQKECGPIQDRHLHEDCVASFGRNEGSSVRQDGDHHDR
jgi:hypothetical protein